MQLTLQIFSTLKQIFLLTPTLKGEGPGEKIFFLKLRRFHEGSFSEELSQTPLALLFRYLDGSLCSSSSSTLNSLQSADDKSDSYI